MIRAMLVALGRTLFFLIIGMFIGIYLAVRPTAEHVAMQDAYRAAQASHRAAIDRCEAAVATAQAHIDAVQADAERCAAHVQELARSCR